MLQLLLALPLLSLLLLQVTPLLMALLHVEHCCKATNSAETRC